MVSIRAFSSASQTSHTQVYRTLTYRAFFRMSALHRIAKTAADVVITLTLWFYFVFGFFVLYYLPRFVPSYLLAKDRETAFQRLACQFLRSFFRLCEAITPGLSFDIPPDVLGIRSSLIVCNHISYLDSILFASLFERHTTIVKSVFLKVPFMGWTLRHAGYIPSESTGDLAGLFVDRVDGLGRFVERGGNFFVFPEGRRSRNHSIGAFHPGAFKLAKKWELAVELLTIEGSDKLFTPGRFLFNTCVPVVVKLRRLRRIEASELSNAPCLSSFVAKIESEYRSLATGGASDEEWGKGV